VFSVISASASGLEANQCLGIGQNAVFWAVCPKMENHRNAKKSVVFKNNMCILVLALDDFIKATSTTMSDAKCSLSLLEESI
jgi:hypothetical protein